MKYYESSRIKKIINKAIILKTSDKLALWGIIITFVYGAWGIYLTNKSINKTDILLTRQNSIIKGQTDLINSSSNQIDTLVSLNKTLNEQLKIYKQIQDGELTSLENQTRENILNLENTSQGIGIMLSDGIPNNPINWDSTKRSRIFEDVLTQIDRLYTNPVLLDNDTLREQWQSEKLSVQTYLNYNSKEERNIDINYDGKLRHGNIEDWKNYLDMLFMADVVVIKGLATKTFFYAIELKKWKYPKWNKKYNIYRRE